MRQNEDGKTDDSRCTKSNLWEQLAKLNAQFTDHVPQRLPWPQVKGLRGFKMSGKTER
jgi:hypothetical protein